MKISVEWPGGGRWFDAQGDRTVLDEVLDAGISAPSSCKRGQCLQCTCYIKGGALRVNHEKTLAPGYFKICEVFALSDLEIQLFEDPNLFVPPVRQMPAKIMSIDNLSQSVVRLSLVFPPKQPFDYFPGQYVEIKNKSGVSRSYSIVSFNPNTRVAEFHVRLIDCGLFSSWIRSSPIGELVQVRGPLGKFFFRNNIGLEETLFIATGTGIAPIISMIASASTEQLITLGRKRIIWGNRFLHDCYISEYLSEIAFKADIEYVPALSREPSAEFSGRVTKFLPSKLNNTQIFAAGNPEMITEVREISLGRGLAPSRFFADAFVPS